MNTATIINTSQERPLSLREKVCYGLCDFGNTLIFDLGQIYLLKFYTDSLNIPPIYAGGVFLFTKIFDAFVDMGVGFSIDKRKKIGPKGRYRPFLLYASLPLVLVIIACFTNPATTLTGQLIWAYLTYMGFGVFYSLVNIPYGSMATSMTKDPVIRTQLAAWRTGLGNIGDTVAMIAVVPIMTMLPFEGNTNITVTIAIFAVICMATYLICYANTREDVDKIKNTTKPPVEFGKGIKAVLKNRPIILLCITNICIFSAFNVKLAVQVYFCQYVLNNVHVISYMGICNLASIFIGAYCATKLVKVIGKKNTYILGCFIFAIGDIGNFFLTSTVPSFLFFAFVTLLGYSLLTSLTWSFVPDAVEYGEWLTGLRTEAVVYSFFIFCRKLSQAIAGFVPGLVLALVGYVPNAVQTAQAIFGFKLLMFIYPSTLAIVALLVWFFFYIIDDKLYNKIITDLAQRANQQQQ